MTTPTGIDGSHNQGRGWLTHLPTILSTGAALISAIAALIAVLR